MSQKMMERIPVPICSLQSRKDIQNGVSVGFEKRANSDFQNAERVFFQCNKYIPPPPTSLQVLAQDRP